MEQAIILSNDDLTKLIQSVVNPMLKENSELIINSIKSEIKGTLNPGKNEPETADKLFSKKSLIEKFDGQLSISKINYLMKQGKLIPEYLGRNVFFRKSSIDALLKEFND